jgi:hypothetical protein
VPGRNVAVSAFELLSETAVEQVLGADRFDLPCLSCAKLCTSVVRPAQNKALGAAAALTRYAGFR